jgi:hypothetical protein
MDRVLDRVRADAGALGITQTPVHLGNVEGGLLLPAFVPGKAYYLAFPEAKGLKVGSDIAELSAFGIPGEVLSEWAARFKGGLNDLQLAAVNDYRILEGSSLLVVAPTSSGKTFIGEMAATRAIVEGRKAAFLLPYRALVNEKFDQFEDLYGKSLGMRVIRCSGDYLDQTSEIIRGKYDLALLTYEMFLNLAVSNPHVIQSLGLVVLDEGQFITDPRRQGKSRAKSGSRCGGAEVDGHVLAAAGQMDTASPVRGGTMRSPNSAFGYSAQFRSLPRAALGPAATWQAASMKTLVTAENTQPKLMMTVSKEILPGGSARLPGELAMPVPWDQTPRRHCFIEYSFSLRYNVARPIPSAIAVCLIL